MSPEGLATMRAPEIVLPHSVYHSQRNECKCKDEPSK